MSKQLVRALSLCLILALTVAAQAPSVSEVYAQIRAEETNNSKIMWLIHQIADVHGPRVTGSPALKSASDWAVKTLTSFGLVNAHLEPWTFQPPSAAKPVPGWENVALSADAVKPFRGQLMVKPLAWTPSTKGVVLANVVMLTPPGMARPGGGGFGGGGPRPAAAAPTGTPPPMPPTQAATPPQQPTRAELDAYLNSMKAKVRGRIVMVGKHVEVAENFTPAPLRRTDEQWKAQFDPNNPAAGGPFGGGGGRGQGPQPLPAGQMTTQEVARAVDQFLVENGALVRINDSGRAYGIIIAQQNNTYDWTRVVPTLVMRNEDYGRIARMAADGTAVTLRVNIQNKLYPEGTTAHNVIAEIPGTDKKDEVVMLGGHFDSWHDATGATDNGIGCSMMMEAVRILATLKVQPRRTIRIALWSGEEQGLLGSIAYVQQHFGTAENPKAEHAKLSAYFNIDSGTSKPRGAGVFGPPDAAAMIREALMLFADWGFTGVRASSSRNLGGTDSTSFNNAGLPGVGLSQDPFDYNTFTHHTNLDTYERIYEEDVREGAVEIASAVYAVAMAEQMVPRFAAKDMPAPVAVPAPGSTAVPAERPAAPSKQPAGKAPAKKPASKP
jgi:carboxypeptidase Q